MTTSHQGKLSYRVEIDPTALAIELVATGTPHRIPVHLTVDFNGDGEIIGFEILNLRDQAGERVLDSWPPSTEGLPRWSYDSDSDAFYFRLRREMSKDQRSVDGELLLNDVGQLTGVRVNLRP